MRRQCELLDLARSTVAYRAAEPSATQAELMRHLDEIYLADPRLGTRRLVEVLWRDHGHVVNCKRLQRLRRTMGVEAIYCRPRTSIPHQGHKVYPYLLRERQITRANKAWCADICFVPPHGTHPCGSACGW